MEVIVKNIQTRSGQVLSHWLAELLPLEDGASHQRVLLRGFDSFVTLTKGKQLDTLVVRCQLNDKRRHFLSHLIKG